MRGEILGKRFGLNVPKAVSGRRLSALMAASVGVVGLVHSAPALAQTPVVPTLFWDVNGTSSGLGNGVGTWAAATVNWNTSSNGSSATVTAWQAGDIAAINTTGALNVADIESVGGITFNANAANSNAIQIGVTGAGPWGLTYGATTFTITNNGTKHIIAVPISGSGDMVITNTASTSTAQINLAGSLAGFTGNLYITNGNATPSATNATRVQLNTPLGNPNATIYMDQNTELVNNNQVVGAGTAGDPLTGQTAGAATTASPSLYTIANNIVLNYKGLAGASVNDFGSARGPNVTVAGVVTPYAELISYAGNISSLGSGATSVTIGGTNGVTVFSGNNTYTGDTTVNVAGGAGGAGTGSTGMFQMGSDHAIPSTSKLILGSGSAAVGPTDLDGHNITIAGLQTGTTNTGAQTVGNIYNLAVNDTTHGFAQNSSGNAASITITPQITTSTTFKGDIGDTDVTNNSGIFASVPYVGNTSPLTNISLTLNGPVSGGTNTLTLAPVNTGQGTGGNEYAGATTVNSGAVLILGRTTGFPGLLSGNPGGAYTITGGGNATVNSGGILASVPTSATTYAGGVTGTIILNSGSTFNPGGVATTGIFSSNSMSISAGVQTNIDFGLSSALYDSVFLNGSLNLDNSGPSTVKLGLATGTQFVAPGIYTIFNAQGGLNQGAGFTLDTSSVPGFETYTPTFNGSMYQVIVSANIVQWDPDGSGASFLNGSPSFTPLEAGGTWTDGSSQFVDYNSNPVTEITWSNAAARDVIIGNDVTQSGGAITLGSNIVVGKMVFGAIANGHNYVIADNGSGNTLTINGSLVNSVNVGIAVANAAASSTTPSAEIDVPIILGADQTWDVSSGQFLDIKGSVTGGVALTKTNSGTVYLENGGGNLSALNINGGTVLIGKVDSVGNAAITLNGGALQPTANMTLSNPLSIGTNGGSFGPTTGTTTLTSDVNGATASFAVIGTGNSVFNGNVTAGPLSVTSSGGVTFNGSVTATTFTHTAGNAFLNSTNTIGNVTNSGGTLTAATLASIGTGNITLSGGRLVIPGVTSIPNNINIGTNGSANMFIDNGGAPASTLAGVMSGNGNYFLVGSDWTIASANTTGNSVNFATEGETIHLTNYDAMGTSTLAVSATTATIDTPVDAHAWGFRTAGNVVTTLTKTGAGMLTLTNAPSAASVSGSALVINQGVVKMMNVNSMGMANTTGASSSWSITANSGTAMIVDFAGERSGGALTLNNASLIRDDGFTGETNFHVRSGAAGTLDVWTISGNSAIIDKEIALNNTSAQLDPANPIIVTKGANLTLESDNTGGFDTNVGIDIRGPVDVNIADAGKQYDGYINFTIQGGATVQQAGPGAVRFGRLGSQGIAIVGQGNATDGDSVLKLGKDFWMTDGVTSTANGINTLFVINSTTGSAQGLRIEAAMNAVYTDPASTPAGAPPGTSGLLGADPYATTSYITAVNVTRLNALSTPYQLNATTVVTPAGTLTLAANDAAGATGLINAGPSSACAVSLALDNASTSGNLVYQIDGTANGGTFSNFKSLSVQRTYQSAGAVTAQLVAPTSVNGLSITGGAKLDVASSSLIVNYTGSSPVADIRAQIKAAYDNGAWDGAGITSSTAAADTNFRTTIGYAEASQLGLANGGTFAGKTIAGNAVLVKYTYAGDNDLDGKVTLNDFSIFVDGFNGMGSGWVYGDYNYSDTIDMTDFAMFVDAYKNQGSQLSLINAINSDPELSTAQKNAMLSVVPEPGTLSLLGVAAGSMLVRRKRRA